LKPEPEIVFQKRLYITTSELMLAFAYGRPGNVIASLLFLASLHPE